MLALLLMDDDAAAAAVDDFPFFVLAVANEVVDASGLGVKFKISHFVSATRNCRNEYVVSKNFCGLFA